MQLKVLYLLLKIFIFSTEKIAMRLFTTTPTGALVLVHGSSVLYIDRLTVRKYELPQGVENNIIGVDVNEEHHTIACAYDNKWICSFNITDCSVRQSVCLKKCPSAISIAIHNLNGTPEMVFIVADKAGDILTVNASDFSRQARVGGHTASIITDLEMICCAGRQYLISCDRDEHIRTSQFPYFCNIESYCVGHRSIINSISALALHRGDVTAGDATAACADVVLVSVSWDHQICLWNCPSGELLDTVTNPLKVDAPEPLALAPTAAPAAPAAPADGDDAGETQDDDNGGGGGDYLARKYNSKDAENIPMKVATISVQGLSVVAVVYRGCKCVHLLSLSFGNEDDNQCSFDKDTLVGLDEVPADVCFMPSGNGEVSLLVTLPGERAVTVYKVQIQEHLTAAVVPENETLAVVQVANTHCSENSLQFSQNIMDKNIGPADQHESGISKHVLDRPYANMVKSNRNAGRSVGKRKREAATAAAVTGINRNVE